MTVSRYCVVIVSVLIVSGARGCLGKDSEVGRGVDIGADAGVGVDNCGIVPGVGLATG